MNIKNDPNQSWKSDIEVALPNLGAWDSDSLNSVVGVQGGIQVYYNSVFSQIPEPIRIIALDRIQGIVSSRTSTHIHIVAFYSAENTKALWGVFGTASFLQNMTEFGWAKALYGKNPGTKDRIIMVLWDKYPLLSPEQLTKVVDGECNVMSVLYPNPYPAWIEYYSTGQDHLRNDFEGLLFQELRQFLFPSLLK